MTGKPAARQRAFRAAFLVAGLATIAALAMAAWPIAKELHAERVAAADPRPAYVHRLRERIQRETETALAKLPRQDRSGRVVLRIKVGPDGALASARVEEPSGFADVDALALRIVAGAAPFEPFPAEVRRTTGLVELVSEFVFH